MVGRGWRARDPGPSKTPKSRKITKPESTKSDKNTLTRHARKRGGGYGGEKSVSIKFGLIVPGRRVET